MGARHQMGRLGSSSATYGHVLPGGTPWGLRRRLGAGKGPWEWGGCVTRSADPRFTQEEVGMVCRSPLEESTGGRVSWFDPSRQPSTTQPLTPPLSQWDGGEDRGKKKVKLVG